MPIRIRATDALLTVATPVVIGASICSFTLRFRLNSLYVPDQFGDITPLMSSEPGGRVMGVMAVSNGNLQFQASVSNDGNSTTFAPTVGLNYHCGLVFGSNQLLVYLNGSLVRTVSGDLVGTLADHFGTMATPFAIGTVIGDQGQCDITISDVAAWNGYALTLTDCQNLRDLILAPGQISPSDLVWALPLNGPDGVAAQVGDAALQDRSTSGLDITTIHGTPAYQGTDNLPYVPPASIASAQVGCSGTRVLLMMQDSNFAPTNISALNTAPTVKINGGSPTSLSSPVWGVSLPPYLPYVIYQMPQAAAGATVDIVTVDGWVTTVAGAAGGQTVRATNSSGSATMLPFDAGVKNMKGGLNIELPSYSSCVRPFADLVLQMNDYAGTAGFTFDAAGNLTSVGPGPFVTAILEAPAADPVDPDNDTRAYPTTGTTTLEFTGGTSSSVELDEITGGHATVVSGPTTVGSKTTIGYTFTPGAGLRSPGFQALFRAPVTNVHVWPPGVPTDGSAVFEGNFLTQMQRSKGFRFMDALQTNSSSVVDIDDFFQESAISCTRVNNRVFGGQVTSVAPFTNDGRFTQGCPLLFTYTPFSGSVPIKQGQLVTLSGFTGPHGDGTFDCSGGGTVNSINGQPLLAEVISPTTFAYAQGTSAGNGVLKTLSRTYTTTDFSASAQAFGSSQYGWSLEACIALCNHFNVDMWINIPHAAVDACVTAMFELIANSIKSGLKVRAEYSNETWNFFSSAFLQSGYCGTQGLKYNVGSGATLGTPVMNGALVSSVPITAGGSGYQFARSFTCTGGTLISGSAAGGLVTISNGQVTGLVLQNGGNYSSPPTGATIGGITAGQWSVLRMSQVHDFGLAAFTAANRASDFIRVMSTQFFFPSGPTQERVTYAGLNGIMFDELAGAPYIDSGPIETSLGSVYNPMSVDEEMDVHEWWTKYALGITQLIDQNRAYLTGPYAGVKFSCYEGGPNYWGLYGGDTGARSRRAVRHPRFRWIMLEFMQQLESKNTTIFNDFTAWGEVFSETVTTNNGGGTAFVANSVMWPVVTAFDQVDGLGDGSDHLFDNRTNYDDIAQIVSVVGGAIRTWNGLVPAPPPSSTSPFAWKLMTVLLP